MPRARRLRGLLLRVVLNRPVAIALGIAMALPGALMVVQDFGWESAVTDGLALLALATGIAIAWSGLTGRQPDWID